MKPDHGVMMLINQSNTAESVFLLSVLNTSTLMGIMQRFLASNCFRNSSLLPYAKEALEKSVPLAGSEYFTSVLRITGTTLSFNSWNC